MNESALKNVMRRVYFKPGAVRTIRVGPMRGLRFRVSDVTGMSPWYSGAERGHQRVFQKFARAGCVAMDIGANWGLHTLYLSRLVGEQGKVVAVECNPRVFAELQWHVEQNGCGNVTALPLAMSDADGQALFAFGPDSYTGHLESVSEQRTAQSTIPVTTSTVDNVVSRLGLARLDLVKIDVEGAEGKVLAGAERTAAAL